MSGDHFVEPPIPETEPVKRMGPLVAVLPQHIASERAQSGGLTEDPPDLPVDATDGTGVPWRNASSGR